MELLSTTAPIPPVQQIPVVVEGAVFNNFTNSTTAPIPPVQQIPVVVSHMSRSITL